MRVLLSGGSGFIGAWIIRRLLARGVAVRVLDARDDRRLLREIAGPASDAVEWRVGDVSDTDTVMAAAEGCDIAAHLAAILTPACRDNPIRGAEINLIGTLNMFLAAKRHGMGRVVYMSSAGVFGPDNGHTPFPTTHYGAFKLACEGSARAFWEDDAIASIGFRPLVVYGPGREVGLTAGPTLACRAAARGESYTIPFSGATDLIFVDDVAAAFEAALLTPFTGAHAFTLPGEMMEVGAVVDTIRAQVPGADIRAEGPLLPIAADLTPGNIAELLPGLPHTSVSAGIAATIAHYRRA